MSLKNFLVSGLILIYFVSSAQTRRFKHLTSYDGISQSEVYAFLEDSRGFMWFGTVDGLNRYDGYSVKIFNTDKNDPHALSNNTIRSLAEDHLGRIWIGTDDGLNYYEPRTEQIFQVKYNPFDHKFPVWSLLIHDEHLLVGTTNGLWRTTIQSNKIEDIESDFQQITNFDTQNLNNFIRAIIKSKHGGIWIQTSNNISRIVFQQNSNVPIVIEDVSFNDFLLQETAIEDSTGNLWIASSSYGLLRYNPGTKQTSHFIDYGTTYGPSSKKCSALTLDKNGNLWVGTLDKGLNFIKSDELNKKVVFFETIQNEPLNENSLNSNLIYSLYVSKNNLLWVGTIGAGLNIFDPEQKKFTHYKFRDLTGESPKSNFIRSVYVDNQNRIWTGTHNNGLFLLDRKTEKFQKLGFETQSIFYISNYHEDKFFICSSTGIYLVQLVNNKLKILSNYEGNAVFNVIKSQKDVYWLATLNGLKQVRIDRDKIIIENQYTQNTQPEISTNNSRVLYYNKTNNELLLGTEGGGLNIVSLDKDQYPKEIKIYKKSTEPNSISNNYVRSIIKDKNQNIWIGTYEGLNKMIRDSISGEVSFQSFTRKEGLPNNMIQFIIEDNNQSLWIGTNGGLSQFIPVENKFINYTVNDGIQSNEFSEHTVHKKPDGEIVMGGINGINAFFPDQIKTSSMKPQTTLTGFYLFNKKVMALEKIGRHVPLVKSITLTDSIILLPKQNSIGFEFSAMIYPYSEKIQYSYILEGFDNEWQFANSSQRNANYTNLSHGDYIFKVKSTNNDGIWEEVPREVFIQIKTPFIYTWYAYIIYALFVLLIFVYFSFYSVIRYTTKNKLLLEKEHNNKLHELDELRTKFFINISHDLRTPLTLINGPLDDILQNKNLNRDLKEKLQLIKRNVKRLSYLVEQLLDVRKAESGKLTPKLKSDDIVSFTLNEVSHFTYALKKKGLELKVSCESENITTSFDSDMISKVYFNIISNAIKYTEKGEIVIHINRCDKTGFDVLKNSSGKSFVKIEIQDSGRGISTDQKSRIFDRFYQNQANAEKGYGIGLSHTKELIEAHRGYIEAESTVGIGTIIRFFLPCTEVSLEPEKIIASSTEDIYFDAVSPMVTVENPEKIKTNTILIVEDNIDMRIFIKNGLKKEYNVVEASDGIDGLKKAEDNLPDLIISDVMMPNMDGIELCSNLKSKIETSHIPVILLTAKVDIETKYEGIETGADDFIPKPFEMEYLLIRIKNLIHSREQLRKLFQKSHLLEPSVVTVTSIDEKFLSSLVKAIEEGIPDSDFSIHTLESKMGMSHANFYRKIKSLTGQSGQELLLNMRMKRAHQVLSDNNGLRISEVAYMVGFTNPKYFSKCFKEIFGFAPSQLIK